MKFQKIISIPRGKNIGKAIINSFEMYNRVNIDSINVTRDVTTKTNVASLSFTYK